MTTIICTKPTEIRWPTAAWLPLVVSPVAVAVLTAGLSAWARMWLLAISVYGGFKWLTFATSPAARRATLGQVAGYLFFWTGMDAEAFFGKSGVAHRTRWSEWVWAMGQTAVGVWLMLVVAPRFVHAHPLVAGWLTLIGVVSILHFGVSQLLSLGWRTAGVNARHIMHKPLLATSLAEFWGRRWNLAFRDLMHRFVLRPLVPRVGSAWAMVAVFFVSGLIHDGVISFAARGGWGLPTLYFLIQALAVLAEKSRLGRRIGLGRGLLGWLFTAAIVIGPAGLLFHPPFISKVVVPMLEWITHSWLPLVFGEAGMSAQVAFWQAGMSAPRLPLLILIGGVLHFGILIASACVPQVLDWKRELAKLDPLSRELVWVHGAFIVLVIIGFGAVSVALPGELAAGSLLARCVCGFIALFWTARLGVQLFVFDARPHLKSAFLRLGYSGLTAVFLYHAVVYSVAAIG